MGHIEQKRSLRSVNLLQISPDSSVCPGIHQHARKQDNSNYHKKRKGNNSLDNIIEGAPRCVGNMLLPYYKSKRPVAYIQGSGTEVVEIPIYFHFHDNRLLLTTVLNIILRRSVSGYLHPRELGIYFCSSHKFPDSELFIQHMSGISFKNKCVVQSVKQIRDGFIKPVQILHGGKILKLHFLLFEENNDGFGKSEPRNQKGFIRIQVRKGRNVLHLAVRFPAIVFGISYLPRLPVGAVVVTLSVCHKEHISFHSHLPGNFRHYLLYFPIFRHHVLHCIFHGEGLFVLTCNGFVNGLRRGLRNLTHVLLPFRIQ